MKITSLLVCLVFSLAGAWGILELSQTADTDWYGLPKLLVAIVLFVVFYVIGWVMIRSFSSGRSRRKKERENENG